MEVLKTVRYFAVFYSAKGFEEDGSHSEIAWAVSFTTEDLEYPNFKRLQDKIREAAMEEHWYKKCLVTIYNLIEFDNERDCNNFSKT